MAYQKTEWIPYETVVSADHLNKIENQLQKVTGSAETNEMVIKSTDTQVKKLETDFNEHKDKNATVINAGHVQLSSAINNESETLAATSKAVKTAYDRADQAYTLVEQAFQSASNGKTLIANAVTGKGIQTSASDSFETMATNISNIKSGYGVGDIISSSKISKYLGEVWRFTGHTGITDAVAVDSDGNVYSGSWDCTVRKINSNGSEVWQFTGHEYDVYSVAVDSNGNVYSGSFDNTVRKINSNGTEVWKIEYTDKVYAVAVDNDGNIYSAGADNTVRKLNSSGTEIWKFTGHTDEVYAVAVDNDGNVYSGSGDNMLRKINSSGTEVWNFTGHDRYHEIKAVAVDNSGNVYSGSYDGTIRKINSSGTEVWKYTGFIPEELYEYSCDGIVVDNFGNTYSSTYETTLQKINSNGKKEWALTDYTHVAFAVAIDSNGNIYNGLDDGTVRKITEGYKIIS